MSSRERDSDQEAPVETREPKEQSEHRKSLVNAEGEPVGDVLVRYVEGEKLGEYPEDSRRVGEIFLEKDGKKVNALELANLPADVAVYVTDDVDGRFSYDPKNKRILAPNIHDATDFATLFHEIGHAVQGTEDRYHAIAEVGEFRNSPGAPEGFRATASSMEFVELGTETAERMKAWKEFARPIAEKYTAALEGNRTAREEYESMRKASAEALKGVIRKACGPERFAFGEMSAENRTLASNKDILSVHGGEWTFVRTMRYTEQKTVRPVDYDSNYAKLLAQEVLFHGESFPDASIVVDGAAAVLKGASVDVSFDAKFVADIDLPASVTSSEEFAKVLEMYGKRDAAKERRQTSWDESLQAKKEYETLANTYPEIQDVLMQTVRGMERDATRRAFVNLRNLKQEHGIDLTEAVPNSVRVEKKVSGLSESVISQDCQDEVIKNVLDKTKEGSFSGLDDLRLALGSYLASPESYRAQAKKLKT